MSDTVSEKTYNLTNLTKIFNRGRSSILNHIKYLNLYTEGQMLFPQATVDSLVAFYDSVKDLPQEELSLLIRRHNSVLKYGVESPNQLEEVKRQRKENFFKKYGVENPSQLDAVKRKKEQTCLKNYGVKYGTQCKEVREKAKKTCLEKYGVEHPLQAKVVKDKSKVTSFQKYGTESPNQCEAVKERQKQSFLKKYGIEKPLQSLEFQTKRTDTIRKKFGADNNSQTQEWKDNWKNKQDEILKKVMSTKTSHIEEFEKNNNCIQRMKLVQEYGLGWTFLPDIPRLHYKNLQFIPNDYIETIIQFYNDSKKSLPPSVSHTEKNIANWIKSFYSGEIIENSRRVIPPLELDMYIPEKKLAIEFNGDYWHSCEVKPKKYHEIKSKLCEEQGVRLIHIYECEWKFSQEKIKSLLRLALGTGYSKIGARQCEVRQITNKEAEPFNDQNHLQNHRNAKVTYGLFYNGELQQLMSFSHHSKYQWEIVRGCPGSNNQVIGGVSKLFKAFVRDYNPDSVFSYCDFNKFDGKGYEALGMKFIGYTGPDKFYVDKSGVKIMRNPRKRKELEESCNFIIWGSGSKKYLWTKSA